MVPSEEISETDFFEIVIGRSKTPRKYKQCIADQVQVFLFIFLAVNIFIPRRTYVLRLMISYNHAISLEYL